jgi:uncharacterized membrane protein HdeD (DUF308 family)
MIGFCVYFAAHHEWIMRSTSLGAVAGLSFLLATFVFRPQSSAFYLAYCIAIALIANAMAAGKNFRINESCCNLFGCSQL